MENVMSETPEGEVKSSLRSDRGIVELRQAVEVIISATAHQLELTGQINMELWNILRGLVEKGSQIEVPSIGFTPIQGTRGWQGYSNFIQQEGVFSSHSAPFFSGL